MSVDHIVPYRIAKVIGADIGINPNDLRNLLCMCRSCHMKKTAVETLLLKGDVMGFLSGMAVFNLGDRVMAALRLFKLVQR